MQDVVIGTLGGLNIRRRETSTLVLENPGAADDQVGGRLLDEKGSVICGFCVLPGEMPIEEVPSRISITVNGPDGPLTRLIDLENACFLEEQTSLPE